MARLTGRAAGVPRARVSFLDGRGTSLTGIHRAPPHQRYAPTKQRPFPSPQVVLSRGLTGYYGRLRRPPGQRSTSRRAPVIGRHAPAAFPQATGPGRASPVPAVTIRTFRAPYAGESLAAVLQDLHRFHGLHPEARGSALPLSCLPAGILTTRQASLHATDHPVAPPKGLLTLGSGTGRFPPTPPACYGASWQLPRPDLHRQATTSATSDQPTT